MCDFIGYKIRDNIGMKKRLILEEDLIEDPELEKVEEQPITIGQ